MSPIWGAQSSNAIDGSVRVVRINVGWIVVLVNVSQGSESIGFDLREMLIVWYVDFTFTMRYPDAYSHRTRKETNDGDDVGVIICMYVCIYV